MESPRDRFAVIREWDIDLLLLEEFWCSPPFVNWFYQRAREANDHLPALESLSCTARHSVTHSGQGSGESDLEVTICGKSSAGDFSVVFLIEDKIDAQFTPEQPERYRTRAEEVRSKQKNNVSMTVIVAPGKYLEGVFREWFDMQVAYEDVIEHIQSADEPSALELQRRKKHRSLAFSHAIDKCRRGGQRINDDDRTRFFDDYFSIVQQIEPLLEQQPPQKRSVGSRSFFYVVSPRLSRGISELFMMHKFQEGWVAIEFRDWGLRRDWYVPKLRDIVEEGMVIKQPPNTIIRVQICGLPSLNIEEPIAGQSDKVGTCVKAAARLLKWYQSHYDTLEEWVATIPRE